MKKLLFPATLLVLGGTLLFATSTINAQGVGFSSFAETLAQKLGKSTEEVTQALDEIHADRHAQMEQNFEDSLNQAVTDGKLTTEQKDQILAKHEEMETKRAELFSQKDSLTRQEFRDQMQSISQDFRTLLTDLNIDTSIIGHGPEMGRGAKGQGRMMNW